MSDPVLGGSQLFARIARDLALQEDLPRTIRRIVELSTQLVGCDIAALWVMQGGNAPTLRAASDGSVGEALDSILTGIEEGIARQALTTRQTVRMDDLEQETRWPRYVAAVRSRSLPIRSAVVYPLELGERDMGALALYSSKPEYFTDQLLDIGGVVADHATIALDAAEASNRAENLARALDSNRRIGMAIGILMALHRVTDEQAFDMLRAASQNNHVKLRKVAEDVIATGTLEMWPSRRPVA